MDVNKITFGDLSIGTRQTNTQKEEQMPEEQESKEVVAGEAKIINPEAYYNAAEMVSNQNKALVAKSEKAQVTQSEKKDIDPADYLSADRMADIEAAVAELVLQSDSASAELKSVFNNEALNNALGMYAVTKEVNTAEVVIQE